MARRWAVVIANDRYWDPRLPKLHAPIHEARQLRDLLRDTEIGGFDPAELLVNEPKAEVEAALERVFRAAEPGDLVVLYFSGHGVRSRAGRLHLAVTNTQVEMLAATSISASFVKELIDESDADATVILLDCCYSGAFVGPDHIKSDPSFDVGAALVGGDLLSGRGVYVITASSSVQQASDGSLRDGRVELSVFTDAVVRGLATGQADVRDVGTISPGDLWQYVRQEVPRRTSTQTPTQYGYVEDEVQLARVRVDGAVRRFDDSRVHLHDLLGPLTQTAERGLRAEQWHGSGRLLVPIGQVRRPGDADGEPMVLDLADADGHMLIVGRPGSGKTTLLRSLIGSLAVTHGSDEIQLYVLESGGNRLGSMRALPSFAGLAGDDEPDLVKRMIEGIDAVLRSRKRMFRSQNVDAPTGFWAVRQQLPDGPHPDVFLVVDRWLDFAERYDDLHRTVERLASGGLEYGIHVVLTGRRWEEFPEPLPELVRCQLEMRLSRPETSRVDPRLADQIPIDRPGWGLRQRRRFRVALPNLNPSATPTGDDGPAYDEASDGAADLVHRVVQSRTTVPDRRAADGVVRTPRINLTVDLLDLLGVRDLAALDPVSMWHRSYRDRLAVPIGVGVDGSPVRLDLKEAAQDGMGPHGLLVGATGAGKSELLRTLVAALALTHSPEDLNVLLVDFKGRATFAPLAALPHTAGVVTDLEAEAELVGRLRDVLQGELMRRQEALRVAGNVASQRDYQLRRRDGGSAEPMPSLLVVVDEFSELLAVSPDFVDVLVQIGRVGRSLGVHLLLASQRLEEGRLRGLDSHLSYRIALRTFSAGESRMVLGVPDAYELPKAAGHGYLKSGTGPAVRFRAAMSSAVRQVSDPSSDEMPVLEAVVGRLAATVGAPARQVWAPPLTRPPSLSSLLPDLVADPVRGLRPDPYAPGTLMAPVGVVDHPFEHRWGALAAVLDGAAGHAVIVGAPQSGKSTMLRTLLCSLALTHTPREVQFFCLDFGGGTLAALRDLPHVSGVATRLEVEAVHRTLAEVSALLEERERRFAEHGVESMAGYRERRAAGGFADDPFGDVFLVVDGWAAVRDNFERYESELTDLARRGLAYGVHLMLTAGRWAEVRVPMRDLLGTRFELRLADPSESEIDRRAAAGVPAVPGRGLETSRLHFLSAVPRIDGRDTDDGLDEGVAELVRRVRQAWRGDPAPPVRLLPRRVAASAVLREVEPRPGEFTIGVGETRLEPVTLDLNRDPHFLVLGDPECGKSNLLRLILDQIAARYPAGQAFAVVGDYRRALTDAVPDPRTTKYATSQDALNQVLGTVVEWLASRLPGPEVTAAQYRARNWWSGPELFVVVDDYDLVAAPSGNPLASLVEYLPMGREVGLHLILARRAAGASRALYEPVIQRLLEAQGPALQMSGSPYEGPLIGRLKPGPLPPGRGVLVRRQQGNETIQVALADAAPPSG